MVYVLPFQSFNTFLSPLHVHTQPLKGW